MAPKTFLMNLEQSLESAYGSEMATLIFENASSILHAELINMEDRGNKAIRKHLTDFILPGYAYYKALMESGINQNEAFDFVSKELHKISERSGKSMREFKNLPFAYGILKLFIKPIMKYGFPKEGWNIVWRECSNKRISFDMNSCLYCEELKRRNALELCPAFCESDHIAYDPLSPVIEFKRTGTLALGSKVCDFCFEKGKLN